MRRATFEKWFNRAMARDHDTTAHNAARQSDRKVDAIATLLGIEFWNDGYVWLKASAAADRGLLRDIQTRLAQLECPKHDYRSDTCVKCGAPRNPGARAKKGAK